MIVRRLNRNDLSTRVEWMNNPRIYGSMHYEVPVCLEKTILWYEKNLNNDARADMAFEEDGELLAMGGLTGINREVDKAELYVFVNPNLLKSGIGTKVTKKKRLNSQLHKFIKILICFLHKIVDVHTQCIIIFAGQ